MGWRWGGIGRRRRRRRKKRDAKESEREMALLGAIDFEASFLARTRAMTMRESRRLVEGRE